MSACSGGKIGNLNCRVKSESTGDVSTCKPLVGAVARGLTQSPFHRHLQQQQQQQQQLLQSMLANAGRVQASVPQVSVVTPFASGSSAFVMLLSKHNKNLLVQS